MISSLDASIEASKGYLLAQARDGFRETTHEMSFPRRSGFRVRQERQSSDLFARAVVARALLESAELDGDLGFRRAIEELSRREALYLAGAKRTDRLGGWSYFPDLPELPPDLDSLSAVTRLFARAAPEKLSLCREPVELALASAEDDGAIGTWLISPSDEERARRTMRRGVERFWGDGADVEVSAHFYLALGEAFSGLHDDTVRAGARYVEARRGPDGLWEPTWYQGRAYAAGLSLALLRAAGSPVEVGNDASRALAALQRSDGGWGVWESESDPHETALALHALYIGRGKLARSSLESALALMLDYQTREGYWKGCPWIRMDVGRARGLPGRVLTYQSDVVTTSFCLRALLLARRQLDDEARRPPGP